MTALLLLSLLADPVPPWLLPAPAAVAPSYRLRKVQHPTLAYVHEGIAFVAEIDRDGAVRFRAPSRGPAVLLVPLAPTGSAEPPPRQSPRGFKLPQPLPSVPRPAPDRASPSPPTCTPGRNSSPCVAEVATVATVTGTFDVDEQLMAGFTREDPHRNDKGRFLAATRELRLDLARVARTRALLRAVGDLPRQLEQIAASVDFTIEDKRALLGEIERALAGAGRTNDAALVAAFQRDRLAQ